MQQCAPCVAQVLNTEFIMQAFSGFNGFGQFGSEQPRKVTHFKAFNVDALDANTHASILITPSWSYTAYASGKQLLLQGFLSPKSNATRVVNTGASIKQIAACDRFCLILLENGQLFKVAPTADAALQEIKFAALQQQQPQPQKRSIIGASRPRECEALQITHIACGANIAVAMDSTHAVYSIPNQVHRFARPFRVQQLLCGFEHALLLSGNGDVYSWGNGLRGQLGEAVLRVEEAPVLIDALAGLKITFIAAGGWHSAAISAFGDLYTWGYNSSGQLGLRVFKSAAAAASGLKQPTVYPLPQVIDLPKCFCSQAENEEHLEQAESADVCSPLRVFAGARHTLLQMQCGAIYASGWNVHGQLSLKKHQLDFTDEFEHIKMFANDFKDADIVCGAWNTVLSKK